MYLNDPINIKQIIQRLHIVLQDDKMLRKTFTWHTIYTGKIKYSISS